MFRESLLFINRKINVTKATTKLMHSCTHQIPLSRTYKYCKSKISYITDTFSNNKIQNVWVFDCSLYLSILNSDSHLPKKFVLFQWKPFKNDEECILFLLKRSFRSQDIEIWALVIFTTWLFGHREQTAWSERQG